MHTDIRSAAFKGCGNRVSEQRQTLAPRLIVKSPGQGFCATPA